MSEVKYQIIEDFQKFGYGFTVFRIENDQVVQINDGWLLTETRAREWLEEYKSVLTLTGLTSAK